MPTDLDLLQALAALVSRWSTALDTGCPSCGSVDDCDHIEGYHHALDNVRGLLAFHPAPEPAGDDSRVVGTDAGQGLSATVRAVTDLWDEPLDEVHDVPQIVNAILAAGWRPPVREAGTGDVMSLRRFIEAHGGAVDAYDHDAMRDLIVEWHEPRVAARVAEVVRERAVAEPMRCTADDLDESGVGRCPCSAVTASGGTCGMFGPPPTFAEAFPYLAESGEAGAR